MNDEPIPFEPESIEAQRARFAAAIADVCLVEYDEGPPDVFFQPGRLRRCVFDSADGMRLVVSREIARRGEVIHLSASAFEGSSLWLDVRDGRIGPGRFVPMAEVRYREISGDDGDLSFLGLSRGKGIPHWFRSVQGGGL